MVLDMKVIGKQVTHMVLEFSPSQMAANMREVGIVENTTVKEFTQLHQEPNMMENGCKESTMGSEHFCGLMEACTKVNGETVEKMGGGNSQVSMGPHMRANGKMENIMAKVN